VGGGPPEARDGTLLAFVGGSAEDVLTQRPVLDALAGRVLHVGPAGSGYAVKLPVNGLWFGQAVATAEALTVGRRMGLELGRELGVGLELASVVSRLHLAALERYRDIDGELLGARLVAERAGVQLRRAGT
jgi:3-hydroxyisobutyrate dehydrogenase-like beta-hydroxyacid dehydrogenase